ncbi:MAG: hypothetical protein HQL95_03670 [Magnetococcales bacterium]|nr:hypothetical protein [Magnetococcales bacterium]
MKPLPPACRKNQSGAMAFVLILLSLFLGLMLGFMGIGGQLDGRRERELLLKSRIYWAMRGEMDYLLSRARAMEIKDLNADHACANGANCVNDADKILLLNSLLGEISEVLDPQERTMIRASADSQHIWFYPEESSAYLFGISHAGGVTNNTRMDNDPTDNDDDGRLTMTWYPAISTLTHATFIDALVRRELGLRVDLCMGSAPGTLPGASCETDNDPTRSQSFISIERLTRVAP